MTHPEDASSLQEKFSSPAPVRPFSWWSRLLNAGQLLLAVGLTTAFLVWLLWGPGLHTPEEHPVKEPGASKNDLVRVLGPGLLHIQPGATVEKKMLPVPVQKEKVKTPLLSVSGTVVASLRKGNGKGDYWQFHTPEILTAYTDWQKALADIVFTQTQLGKYKALADARETAQKKVVNRLIKTVAAGTEAEKDLDEAKLKLLEQQIQGSKEVYEAETQVKIAQRTEAALTRQLQLSGLDPELLRTLTNETDIVIAEVPESKVSLVKVKQKCTAQFFGIPGEVFNGEVTTIAPVLSKEKRTLRVLFLIEDKEDHVRAGMYGEIGLGTDERETLFMPSEGVLRIGQHDYALVAAGAGKWQITKVQVGDVQGKQIEIVHGLKEGDEVMGQGVILLKPYVTQALYFSGSSGAKKGSQLEVKKNPS